MMAPRDIQLPNSHSRLGVEIREFPPALLFPAASQTSLPSTRRAPPFSPTYPLRFGGPLGVRTPEISYLFNPVYLLIEINGLVAYPNG